MPWGFYKRLYTVEIPEGIRNNQRIRLKGQGKKNSAGQKGDIYLKINELSNSRPVDLKTSSIIKKVQEQGIIVLALTSRDDKLFKTTLR